MGEKVTLPSSDRGKRSRHTLSLLIKPKGKKGGKGIDKRILLEKKNLLLPSEGEGGGKREI